MKLILESERLLLRPVAETDIDIACALLMDPAVMRYVGGEPYSRERVDMEAQRALRRGAGGCIGIWCVTDKASDEKLGTGVLLPLPIEESDTNWDLVQPDALPDAEIEVGYLLKPSAWGKGYATEACKRLLRFAFEETPLSEIVAITAAENTASQHVLRKSGLRFEGLRRAYGGDCPGFRLGKAAWLAATGR